MLKFAFNFSDVSVLNAKQGFRHVSVGHIPGHVWAISGAGIVCRRIGITEDNPAGSGWATGIGVSVFFSFTNCQLFLLKKIVYHYPII